MSVFSTNQVRHLYVAKAVESVTSKSNWGSLELVDKDNCLYFKYKSADNLVRSDLINKDNIIYVNKTSAEDLTTKLKSFEVKLDTTINGGKLVVGQDYILRIAFSQYLGMSDEDQYFKYGMVHAYAGMDIAKFFQTLAVSLYKNFSRENTELVEFILGGKKVAGCKLDANGKTVPTDENGNVLTGQSIIIKEVEQEWALGTKPQVPVYFNVYPTTIVVGGDEVTWGNVIKKADEAITSNGKIIADLEYFCMGERADMYRRVSWPHNIETKYLVDPSKNYDVIDIHYAFTDEGIGVQKSEKTITIVAEPTVLESVKTALEAKGVSVHVKDTTASAQEVQSREAKAPSTPSSEILVDNQEDPLD